MDDHDEHLRYIEQQEDESLGSPSHSPALLFKDENDINDGSHPNNGISQQLLTYDQGHNYTIRSPSSEESVTYRMVQVVQGDDGQQRIVSGFSGEPVTISTNNNNSIHGSRAVHIPIVGTNVIKGAATEHGQQFGQASVSASAVQQIATGGPFYIVMPQEDSNTMRTRPIMVPVSRTDVSSSRLEQRKTSHKEVERRRRDKINTWIVHLSKLVPGCDAESARLQESKCTVLSKACEYIIELKNANTQMGDNLKETERYTSEAEMIRVQCEQLQEENEQLSAQFLAHGLVPPSMDRKS